MAIAIPISVVLTFVRSFPPTSLVAATNPIIIAANMPIAINPVFISSGLMFPHSFATSAIIIIAADILRSVEPTLSASLPTRFVAAVSATNIHEK